MLTGSGKLSILTKCVSRTSKNFWSGAGQTKRLPWLSLRPVSKRSIRAKPSGTGTHVEEHPTDDALIRVLLSTLVDKGQVLERDGVFSFPPPHTLDSEWRW
jgi:hypothetical protein